MNIFFQSLRDKRIFSLLSKPVVYHSLFWLVLLVAFTIWEVYDAGFRYGFFHTLSLNVIMLVILGGAVYYNIYVLIPKYLAHKQGWKYFLHFTLLILVVSPIENFLLYTQSHGIPQMRAEILSSIDMRFFANFFVVGTSTLVKITLDWLKNQRETQELQTKTMQSELQFLKSQINPHFLFNTLNSLYALTLKKSDKAPDIVLKLSEMMRYMLYECNEPLVPLSKEVHYIKNYLELEKLRQGKNVDIDFVVEGLISNQKIAPLMFMSFIENCFKHGLGNNLSKGFVKITLHVLGDEVNALIENSKPESMPKPLHARSGGIGLVNVSRRLDLLYPKKYSLDIEDAPNTYSVNLKIQLNHSAA
ncbi:MAG: histidine kinase [Bacteroidota bacterium]